MTEYANAARELVTDGAAGQISAGRDFKLIVSTLDDQRDRAALRVEAPNDVLQDFLLYLARVGAVRGLVPQRVQRADPGKIGDASGGVRHEIVGASSLATERRRLPTSGLV